MFNSFFISVLSTAAIPGLPPLPARVRRFSLVTALAVLCALPLAAIVYQAVSEIDSEIIFIRKEQYGVQYHDNLVDLLQALQKIGKFTYQLQKGKASVDVLIELDETKNAVRRQMAKLDEVDAAIGAKLGVNRQWQDVRKKINSLLDSHSLVRTADEIETTSEAITQLLDFQQDLADQSNMSLDQDIDTDYLADVLTHGIPDTMHHIGKISEFMNAEITAGRQSGQWNSSQIKTLLALSNALEIQNDDLENALKRASHAQPLENVLDYYRQQVAPKLNLYRDHIREVVQGQKSDVTVAELFRWNDNVIGAYDLLYDKVADEFLRELRQREGKFGIRKDIVLYSSLATLLGFVALFLFLYRALARTECAEHKSRRYATQLEQQYAELEKAKAQAESANVAKSDFLANMSHELRTPLGSVIGMTRLLMESNLEAEHAELARVAFQSSTNLLEIVNDILDLSKIEAGDMQLERIGFDLNYVLMSVTQSLEHLCTEKNLALVRDYPKAAFPFVLGDPTRLSRILVNLIGNAIKYTEKGYVELYAETSENESGHVIFRCEVKDTGIGIPKNKFASIFDKFVQADSSTTRKYGGTGLGLTITKQLVEMMGGAIGLESTVGEGSIFWFAIPFEVTGTLTERKQRLHQRQLCGIVPLVRARVLVAEDHPLNQLLVRKLLSKFGIGHVHIVGDGNQAMECWAREPWDVILIDCHMPGKNGYDATEEIRRREKGSLMHVPIVAMTANAMEGDREKCLRHGMDDYISKPINPDHLRDVLSQWLRFEEGAAQAAP